MDPGMRMLMATARNPKPVVNLHSTLLWPPELHFHPQLSLLSQLRFQSLLQSSPLQVFQHLTQLLPRVFQALPRYQALKARPNLNQAMLSTVSTVGSHRRERQSNHLLQRPTMPSATRPLQHNSKVRSQKAITQHLNLSHNHPNPAPFPLPLTNFPNITLPTRNEMRITASTISNTSMGCSKVLRANKKVLALNSDHTAGTVGLNLKARPSSLKALLSQTNHDIQLLVRVKTVGTRRRIPLLNNQVQTKDRNHNKATLNNLKAVITRMATLTFQVHIMLHT
jgi:hypothetical protein